MENSYELDSGSNRLHLRIINHREGMRIQKIDFKDTRFTETRGNRKFKKSSPSANPTVITNEKHYKTTLASFISSFEPMKEGEEFNCEDFIADCHKNENSASKFLINDETDKNISSSQSNITKLDFCLDKNNESLSIKPDINIKNNEKCIISVLSNDSNDHVDNSHFSVNLELPVDENNLMLVTPNTPNQEIPNGSVTQPCFNVKDVNNKEDSEVSQDSSESKLNKLLLVSNLDSNPPNASCVLSHNISTIEFGNSNHFSEIENHRTEPPLEYSASIPENSSLISNRTDVNDKSEIINKKYRCKLCCKIYSDLDSVKKHIKLIHSGTLCNNTKTNDSNDNFKCPSCFQGFPTETGRNRHYILMHVKNGPISCTHCSIKFPSFRPLEKHLSETHGKNPTFVCDRCDRVFILRISLDHHKKIIHRDRSKLYSLKACYNHLKSQKKSFDCFLCNKTCLGIKSYKNHHIKVHNGLPFNCKHCKFKSTSQIAFKKHLASVHQEITIFQYECSKCKVGYHSLIELEEHYILSHNFKKNNKCTFCGEGFASIEMLRYHKGKHKPYPCDICPNGFMKHESFNSHMNTIHKDDMKTQIDDLHEVCESNTKCMSFGNESTYQNSVFSSPDVHEVSKVLEINSDGAINVKDDYLLKDDIKNAATHHLHNTREGKLLSLDKEYPLKRIRMKDLPRKVECPICNKLLTTRFLNTHMLAHRNSFPYKCTKCSKQYAQGTLLRKHMKNRHYEDFLKLENKFPKKKKIKCEFCDLVCDDIYLLENHLWSHMKEKKYSCKSCKIKFGMKINWIEHYKTHYFQEERLCPTCQSPFKSIGFYREHIELCMKGWACDSCGLKCENPIMYRIHKNARNSCNQNKPSFLHPKNKQPDEKSQYNDNKVGKKMIDSRMSNVLLEGTNIQVSKNPKKFKCKVCNLTFINNHYLLSHMEKHFQRQFKCMECDCVYFSRQCLDNHVSVYHLELYNNPYVCSICSQIFNIQIRFKHHLIKHGPRSLLICLANGCFKKFKNDSQLRFHTTKHHSNLKYLCHICYKDFLMEDDLKKHFSVHKLSTDLFCINCRFTSNIEKDLLWHTCKLESNESFECDSCKFKTREKDSLILHFDRNHYDNSQQNHRIIVYSYKCTFCEKYFLSEGVFNRHLEQHSLEGKLAKGVSCRIYFSHISPVFANINKLNGNIGSDILSIKWENLLASMKVQVLFQGECSNLNNEKGYTSTSWQCPNCFLMTNNENEIQIHMSNNLDCFSVILAAKGEYDISNIEGVLYMLLEKPNENDNGSNNKFLLNPECVSLSDKSCIVNNKQYLFSNVFIEENLQTSSNAADVNSCSFNFEPSSSGVSFDIDTEGIISNNSNFDFSEIGEETIENANDILSSFNLSHHENQEILKYHEKEPSYDIILICDGNEEVTNNVSEVMTFCDK